MVWDNTLAYYMLIGGGGGAGKLMIEDSGSLSAREPLCVALTQPHRGHGVSTAAYYLGRALVERDRHVLLGDLSERSSPLAALVAHVPVKNLVVWRPPLVAPAELTAMLRQARQSTAGRADVVLLDMDVALLEHHASLDSELSYLVAVTGPTEEDKKAASTLAERLHARSHWLDRVGVLISRVDPPSAEALPGQVSEQVPVLGWLPADYLLAEGESYSAPTNGPPEPHEGYLNAIGRLAQVLIRLVPLDLRRQAGAQSGAQAGA